MKRAWLKDRGLLIIVGLLFAVTAWLFFYLLQGYALTGLLVLFAIGSVAEAVRRHHQGSG